MFNEQGHIENPSDEMVKNINAALYYGNISNGSFDITVQPILDLYTYSFQELRRPPTSEEIDSALILVDYNDIFIKKNLILFRKEGMKITLGGITKGYAIDKAIEVLEDRGIEHALVNAGGDMRVIGSKPDGKWKIALQNPRDEKDFITIIDLDNVAVATSGDYERYFNENKSFHHIVDPRTGYSATSLMSVTIIASKAMDADAIATSVFVLGKEKGLELIESLNDVEGLVITEEKEIVKSSDFNY
jgi:thiamine biosynthesis lipoprotein